MHPIFQRTGKCTQNNHLIVFARVAERGGGVYVPVWTLSDTHTARICVRCGGNGDRVSFRFAAAISRNLISALASERIMCVCVCVWLYDYWEILIKPTHLHDTHAEHMHDAPALTNS